MKDDSSGSIDGGFDHSASRPYAKVTYSHLLPSHDHIKPRFTSSISPRMNIGRMFSPASVLSKLNIFNDDTNKEETPYHKRTIQSVQSTANDSASDFNLHNKKEIIAICYDWDEKLADLGYGQDVVSEGDTTVTGEDVYRSTRHSTIKGYSSDKLTVEKSLQDGDGDRSISTRRSTPSSFRQSSKGSTRAVSFGSVASAKLFFKDDRKSIDMSFNLSDGEMTDMMRRATQYNLKTSMNMLDHILVTKGFDLNQFRALGWEKVKEGRTSTVRLTREMGRTELENLLHLREVTLVISCKNGELRLVGSDLQQRIGRRVINSDLPKICHYLMDHPEIKYLNLAYNQITSEGLHFLTSFLSINSSIVGLNLMCNNITEILSSDVIDTAANTTLKSLRLNGNFLGRKSGEYLSFLIMFKNLDHLDISQTDQTVLTLPWMIQAIFQSRSLRRLDASRLLGQPGYGEHTKHVATLFGDLLRINSNIVELHIEKNGLGDHDMVQLFSGFWKNCTLQLLDLSCNRIGDYGAEIIAMNLEHGAPLKVLMLSHNHIGDSGARALSFKLPGSQVKLLDLSHNRIGDDGVADIIYTVRKPYPLLALFIFGNKISEATSRVILKQLDAGNLMAKSLDVKVACIGNEVHCSHNQSADRYRLSYYNVPRYGVTQPYRMRRELQEGCGTKHCLNYMYHNVVSLHPPLQRIIPGRDLEPCSKIKGTCII
ncbi:uncharacterized protein LOC106670803 isoform X2 [Cimex lectularius]|nr:uncharacterized protein LOC106670803 isoform X2 [Cimex lectularius]